MTETDAVLQGFKEYLKAKRIADESNILKSVNLIQKTLQTFTLDEIKEKQAYYIADTIEGKKSVWKKNKSYRQIIRRFQDYLYSIEVTA